MNEQDPITTALEGFAQAGVIHGAATLILRNGKIVHAAATGSRDLEAKLPVESDTIFRIASLSKPIVSTAALMLLQEGRFALADPISRFAPEFKDMRVLKSLTGPVDETEPANRQITFEDLLTHQSGITYGSVQNGPIGQAYRDALGREIDSDVAPDAWIAGLASLPLIDHPGTTLHYGHSTDLLGLLIARIEGAPLGDVLERRIFSRIGMNDTSFDVPSSKALRKARLFGFDNAGQMTMREVAPGGSTVPNRPADMSFVSGGQGLWSTVHDFATFAKMFVGNGMVDGVQLLQPETLAMMMSNHLTSAQRESAEVVGWPLFAAGHGFGMGIATVMEPELALPTICGGGLGAVGWPGAFGGWWQADPNDKSVMVFLTHNMIEPEQFATGIGMGVYEVITKFQALGSRRALLVEN